MTTNEINAGNFHETFPLDFPQMLCEGVSNITIDSAIVTQLVNWCADRGYEVSREVCLEVLESQVAYLTEKGIDE